MSERPVDYRPSAVSLWFTVSVVIGCFAIFAVVLWLSYLPERRTAPMVDVSEIPEEERWRYTPEGRQARLAEQRAREVRDLTTYGWLDRGDEVVRLPIDRAIELTVREINEGRY